MNKMLKAMLVLGAVFTVTTVFAAGDGDPAFRNFAEAKAQCFVEPDVKLGWTNYVRRGGVTIVRDQTYELDEYGRKVAWDSNVTSMNRTGTVMSAPIGDFQVEGIFGYHPGSGRTTLTGALVSVAVQISGGSANATELVRFQSVKNMVESGVSVPASVGKRPMHIMAMKKAVLRRYGAKNVFVRYDGKNCRVQFLLEDCKEDKADASILPATPDGLSRKERLEKLSLLEENEDKGGTTWFGITTVIYPSRFHYVP